VTPPDQLTVNLDGYQVRLTDGGQASLKAAYSEIAQENEPQDLSGKLFGKKHAAEETAREQEWLSKRANENAAAFATRMAALRAAATQAAADQETVTAALG
jgi:hypothetical protein